MALRHVEPAHKRAFAAPLDRRRVDTGRAVKFAMVLLAMCATLVAATERIYVANSGGDDISVLDPATNAVTGTIRVSDHPHGIGIAPDGKSLWVTSLLDNSVSVFSLPDLKRLSTTHVGKAPDWMTFSADGSKCYVSNAGSDAVSVLDVASHKELTRVPVGAMPKRIISIVRP